MNGINCSRNGCLASVAWLGHPKDPALANYAEARGWRVHEGSGWVCPRHASDPRGFTEWEHEPDEFDRDVEEQIRR